jgi:preprotein translocase subunit SecF
MSDDTKGNGTTDGPTDAPTDAPTEGSGSIGGRGTPGDAARPDGARHSVWGRLYHGETNIDFVGRTRLWFALSGTLILIGVVAFVVRGGFNLGIDFEGGVVWEVPAQEVSVAEVRDAVAEFGLAGSTIQEVDGDEGRTIRVEAEPVEPETSDEISATLAELTGNTVDDVVLSEVGPSWGEEISSKALRALIVFLVLVTIYITLRFEWKMALPTLVALFHDILITAGFYAVTQIEITPATVIALLTILGYSIYDGVVVFDKVDENTRYVSSTGGLSYSGMVDVSLNQALMRSLNTNITALLPVLSLLVIGSWVMGAAVIEEFAIPLFIGQLSGAYSSIFIASPLLAWLKEREPRYRDIRRRIDARGGDAAVVAATIALGRPPSGRVAERAAAAPSVRSGGGDGGEPRVPASVAPSGRAIPPRPRKKSKRPGR